MTVFGDFASADGDDISSGNQPCTNQTVDLNGEYTFRFELDYNGG